MTESHDISDQRGPEIPLNPSASIFCSSEDVETSLTGGRLTKNIMRVGDTVRRPFKPSSSFVAKLLYHLESQGFAGAPRYLGRDDQGRDKLSYIPGWVPVKFQSFTDKQISEAGELLRAFHDATTHSKLADGRAVVCHNDPGPNNVVFQEDRPVALIDFDMAAPGEPIEDLGYMAWTWCVSSKPTRGLPRHQAAQLRVLSDAYSLDAMDRHHLVNSMLERQTRNARFWREVLLNFGGSFAEKAEIEKRVSWSEDERAFTQSNRTVFAAALM